MYVVEGADQLAALSKKLKEAGNKELQRELSKGVTLAMKPLAAAVRASAASTLPQSGGLAAKVAKSQMRTQKRASGVRLVARNAYVLQRLDDGTVRHPVYGRGAWVTQQVPPGWWTRPTESAAPAVRAAIVKAMDAVAAKIT